MSLYDSIWLGFSASYILPLRAGEVIRPLLLSRWENISFSRALASVVLERVIDIVVVLLLLALVILEIGELPNEVLLGAKALLSIVVVGSVFIAISYFKSELVLSFSKNVIKTLFRRNLGLGEKIFASIRELVLGFSAIQSFRHFILIIFQSFLLWSLIAAIYHIALIAFLKTDGSFVAAHLVNVTVALVIAAPSAPGFVGTFQAGCVLALDTILNYGKEFSLAYSIYTHFSQFAIVLIWAVVIVFRRGLKFGELFRKERS